jgi:hypothetical protein
MKSFNLNPEGETILIDLGTDVSVILIGRLGNRAEDLD